LLTIVLVVLAFVLTDWIAVGIVVVASNAARVAGFCTKHSGVPVFEAADLGFLGKPFTVTTYLTLGDKRWVVDAEHVVNG